MRDEPSAEHCALLIELAHAFRHLVASVDVSPPAGTPHRSTSRRVAVTRMRPALLPTGWAARICGAAALGALAGIEFYDGDISDSLANHRLGL
jgi:hypothetical protein